MKFTRNVIITISTYFNWMRNHVYEQTTPYRDLDSQMNSDRLIDY